MHLNRDIHPTQRLLNCIHMHLNECVLDLETDQCIMISKGFGMTLEARESILNCIHMHLNRVVHLSKRLLNCIHMHLNECVLDMETLLHVLDYTTYLNDYSGVCSYRWCARGKSHSS